MTRAAITTTAGAVFSVVQLRPSWWPWARTWSVVTIRSPVFHGFACWLCVRARTPELAVARVQPCFELMRKLSEPGAGSDIQKALEYFWSRRGRS